MLSENEGKITHTYAQLWMGHGGDIETVYTTRKHQLPLDILENMREAFKRVSENLQTIEYKPSASEDLNKFKNWLLITAGFSQDQINSMNIGEMTDEQVAEKLAPKEVAQQRQRKQTETNSFG